MSMRATIGCPDEESGVSKMTFQKRVQDWLIACFGIEDSVNQKERAHRFLEEALELAQAGGCTADEAARMVDYVFSRPTGTISQETGGVMTTLAALCSVHDVDMAQCGEDELISISKRIDAIRQKRLTKPNI